jgi:hypothetical protein
MHWDRARPAGESNRSPRCRVLYNATTLSAARYVQYTLSWAELGRFRHLIRPLLEERRHEKHFVDGCRIRLRL